MAIVLSATWIAKPGREHVVREALERLAPATRTEEGNLLEAHASEHFVRST